MTAPLASAYRATQIATASPAEQIVLLYQGAIRHGLAHLAALERGQIEAAHRSSMRAQEIVAALRASLDHSAGPIAGQLEQLYTFVLERLVAGNMGKTPGPTQEALEVLRGLLPAWQAVAAQVGPREPSAGATGASVVAQPGAQPSSGSAREPRPAPVLGPRPASVRPLVAPVASSSR